MAFLIDAEIGHHSGQDKQRGGQRAQDLHGERTAAPVLDDITASAKGVVPELVITWCPFSRSQPGAPSWLNLAARPGVAHGRPQAQWSRPVVMKATAGR